MSRPLASYKKHQVFLNYPFDAEHLRYSEVLAFAVVAAGLLPVCALDFTTPDRPRLQVLVEAIDSCDFSAHDLSRSQGYGEGNLARMNMPIEMGMALFHALRNQHTEHRCAFFVQDPHTYKTAASDLAGLDPIVYGNSEDQLLARTFDWLREVAPVGFRSDVPTPHVLEGYAEFRSRCGQFKGSYELGALSHVETRELMYQVCGDRGWWDWRGTKAGREAFPIVPMTKLVV